MRQNQARSIVALLATSAAVAGAFYVWSGSTRVPTNGVPDVTGLDISFTLAFASFLPLGALVALRRPQNPIGWIMIVSGFSVATSAAAGEYSIRAELYDPGSLPWGPELGWISSWIGVPGVGMLTFLMLLFPTGEFLSSRWRWVGRIAAVDLMVLFIGTLATWPERGVELVVTDTPSETFLVPPIVFEVAWVSMMVGALVGLSSLIVRFRRSRGVERQQLKWMAYVAALLAILVIVNLFIFDLIGVGYTRFRIVSEYILNLSVVGIPAAAALAILRYRLYDIDRLINRTLVYGGLSTILGTTYAALVFTAQSLLARFTVESDLVIAGSTLAVAGLFRPIRNRLQVFIDRRFYRQKFNARTTMEAFSASLRQEVDIEALSVRLVDVVEETMKPAHVSLWLSEHPSNSVAGHGWRIRTPD